MGDWRYIQLIFYFKDCRIKISFYFFALLSVAALSDRSGITLCGLIAALLHESGHIAAMLALPDQAPAEITLSPFGVRIEKRPLSEFGRGNVLILAAGSGVNFLCAAVTFGFFPRFAAVSLILGILNILPVEGMDGGGILIILLSRHSHAGFSGYAAKVISWTTLCAMSLIGTYVLIVTKYNFTLLGMTAALALKSRKPTADRRFNGRF